MAFFGLLKKKQKFYEEQPTQEDNTKTMNIADPSKPDPILQMMASIPDQSSQTIPLKTYDIIVFEPNPDGSKKQMMVSGVKAHSPKELAALYAADGAQIQVIKEYGGEQPQQPQPPPQQTPVKDFSDSLAALNRPVEPALKQAFHEAMKATTTPQKFFDPPKYFEIGGVKCKLENGKMFQEQWVRVDSSKYRLIADSTNKLVSMNGKHLETLKWVQIENTEENEDGEEDA